MILVVGGAGYLGSCVVDELVVREQEFRVYDNLLYQNEYRRPVSFAYGDVTDYERLKHYLDQSDTVIWLAALVGDGLCMLDPIRARAVNQDSVEFLTRNFDGEIIFASTCSIYGYSEFKVNENYPVKPLSIYAETKLNAESFLQDINRAAIILRLGTLHGVSERMRFDLVVNAMARSAYYKKKVTVWGGAQRRPLLSVGDAAMTIVDLVVTDKWVSGTFNLATENLSVDEIAVRVATDLGADFETIAMPSEDRRDYSVSSKLAQEWFGFSPIYTIGDSVAELAELFLSGRLKDPFSSRYSNQEAYKWNQA